MKYLFIVLLMSVGYGQIDNLPLTRNYAVITVDPSGNAHIPKGWSKITVVVDGKTYDINVSQVFTLPLQKETTTPFKLYLKNYSLDSIGKIKIDSSWLSPTTYFYHIGE